MKILVCGGRDFSDVNKIAEVLSVYTEDVTLAHGNCKGADKLSEEYAIAHNWKVVPYPANWALYGKQAGPLRNQKMLVDFKPDVVVAFPGGKGTEDMVYKAKRAGIKLVIVE
jgi:hypothetical protein